MQKPNAMGLAGVLLAVLAIMGGAALLKGGLYAGKHEGDTLHLLDIVFRMNEGQWPHLDFMTPIGVLAFAPITLFVHYGQGIGHAILWSQVLVAAVLLPAAWWAGASRLTGVWPYLFGAFVIVLATALVHGEAERSVSISMHYNRWSWAFAYVVIVVAVLDPVHRRAQSVDGLVIGLGMAALALCKITYFLAFAPAVLVALIVRRQWRALGVAALAGIAVAALVTVLAGPAFWIAYLRDLLAVAGSEVRPQPGEPLSAVIAAPLYLGGSLVAIGGVILLRQARAATPGLLLLLLVPGFFFVTYQNFANDPQWLPLVGLLLFTCRPAQDMRNVLGWEMRHTLAVAGSVALALAAPSAFNLIYSPFRHLGAEVRNFAPLLPRATLNADLQSASLRVYRVDARIPLDTPGTGLEAWAAKAKRDKPAVLNGETLPLCEVDLGMPAWFDTVSADLEQAGHAGKRIFAADLFDAYWLFGDFRPLRGGAPWYYGGLPGLDDADLVIVPLCPIVPDIRQKILAEIGKQGVILTEIRRTPLYILLAKNAP